MRTARTATLALVGVALLLGSSLPASAQYPDPPQPEGPVEPTVPKPADPKATEPPAQSPGANARIRSGASDEPYHKQVQQGLPQTPAKRAQALGNLYALLATAPDQATATEIATTIEGLWRLSYSDTVAVLLDRAAQVQSENRTELAIKLLDAVVELAPDFADGWYRRAILHYGQNDFARALGDLRRALALEPNHFRAMEGLAQVLREAGQKKGALEAYRQVMGVHPFIQGGEETLRELEREVEGQGI
ncbi:MAG: tetratricopeptide repeat protein [Hyphomicrobiaceae bacterium]|nr:tetratricopeptide repeat protein [Hyphomicrobiaceae bacterium]